MFIDKAGGYNQCVSARLLHTCARACMIKRPCTPACMITLPSQPLRARMHVHTHDHTAVCHCIHADTRSVHTQADMCTSGQELLLQEACIRAQTLSMYTKTHEHASKFTPVCAHARTHGRSQFHFSLLACRYEEHAHTGRHEYLWTRSTKQHDRRHMENSAAKLWRCVVVWHECPDMYTGE